MSHPSAIVPDMNTTLPSCDHQPRTVAGIEVATCSACLTIEWWGQGRPLDPAEGLARLFGEFDLVDRIPAVHAPAPEILVYRPPQRRARSRLGVFPELVWLEAAPDLWLSHDGTHLLLAPTDPLLLANLDRHRG